MKVLMINGSRRERGCTAAALGIIAESLKEEGVDSEIVFAGRDSVNGSLDNLVESLKGKCAEADGFVFASPVYYASPSGEIEVVLDRLFRTAGGEMRCKPCAVAVSARRAGTSAALEALAKYPSINEMPIVSSCYWTMVHGSEPEEISRDEEGSAVMRQLGKNMSWILKCIKAGAEAGENAPAPAEYRRTNFIR